MENENRSKRPMSIQKLSNRDRELQRIKSLAVVSVLNKTFEESAPIAISSSSSSTTSASVAAEKSRTRSASNSSNGSLGLIQKHSNTSLFQDMNRATSPHRVEPPPPQQVAEPKAEMNITREQLVSSPVNQDDTEKETLGKQFMELQALYEHSIAKLKSSESRAQQQTELILLQDRLVHELSDQIQHLETNDAINKNAAAKTTHDVSQQALEHAQEELVVLKNEVLNFKPLKEEYEMLIVTLSRKLADSQARVEKMERAAIEIKKECVEQTAFIDTKVQVMMQQLQEKNKIIRKLEKEQQRRDENDVDPPSARSSIYSSNSQRKSFVAKWKGGAIPPAAPPPTLPLPPVPDVSSSNRPTSYLSIASNNQDAASQYTHMSIDAVGGTLQRRGSNFSEFETEMTDAEYYKEFTDQLQARLSISKEVDDLRLWEPSDFAEIQRKIDSNSWFDEDHQGQKDQNAFWKGMKKKLRV
ncbi:hypothetical protein K501DRAFT_284338 [Backusella circina FSU 941]|nr:hypothetical protein K501DRAFT_284338 [Backusella circina FSU 941]